MIGIELPKDSLDTVPAQAKQMSRISPTLPRTAFLLGVIRSLYPDREVCGHG